LRVREKHCPRRGIIGKGRPSVEGDSCKENHGQKESSSNDLLKREDEPLVDDGGTDLEREEAAGSVLLNDSVYLGRVDEGGESERRLPEEKGDREIGMF